MITTPNLLSPGRRQFLQQSCVGIAALTVLGNPLQALAAGQSNGQGSSGAVKKPVFSSIPCVTLMEKSVADTLKLVAGVGYGDVEFAGYFGHSAEDIRKLLDANGLAAPSVHVPLEVLRSALPQVIIDAKVIGHQYIVLPWLSEEQRGDSIDNYKKLAVELNGFAKPIKDAGLQLAYHNHDFELLPVKGGVPYDVLLGETDQDLVKMELDLFWAVKAGVDPLKLFAANPGRLPAGTRQRYGERRRYGRRGAPALLILKPFSLRLSKPAFATSLLNTITLTTGSPPSVRVIRRCRKC